MVEIQDNIRELPAFIEYSIGAFRVYEEALAGEGSEKRGMTNLSATKNPHWKQYIIEAKRLAAKLNLLLNLPPKLDIPSIDSPAQTASAPIAETDQTQPINESTLPQTCSWMKGLWVNINGSMRSCCFNQTPHMGNIHKKPLKENVNHLHVKNQFLKGNVFRSCIKKNLNLLISFREKKGWRRLRKTNCPGIHTDRTTRSEQPL